MNDPPRDGTLIVIPTLNEAEHIHAVLDQLDGFMSGEVAANRNSIIVVADGGSTDKTREIVKSHVTSENGRTILIDNPDRFQSAGINRAVKCHGDGRAWLVRIDAHARYPSDYCNVLIAEAEATGAASVVVPMRAVGVGLPQAAIALTQNSRLGNGGASHRTGEGGCYVDHGHHALIRLDAFRAVGGYDPTFRHNEDAELDLRLSARAYGIWQTAQTRIDYIPRVSLRALARQYAHFGAGRAATLRKHRLRLRLRQMVVAALAPLVALSVLTPIWPAFAVPTVVWGFTCLIAGQIVARAGRGPTTGFLVSVAAGVMHLAWSIGFWRCMLALRPIRPLQRRQVPE